MADIVINLSQKPLSAKDIEALEVGKMLIRQMEESKPKRGSLTFYQIVDGDINKGGYGVNAEWRGGHHKATGMTILDALRMITG